MVKMMIGSVSYVEGVVHVLWECPVYDTIRKSFMEKLDTCCHGGSFEKFVLNNLERTGFV